MIDIVPFKLEHFELLNEQSATAYLKAYARKEALEAMAYCGPAFTGFIEGRVVACAGVIEFWPGRGEAWAVLDQVCKREFLMIHNAVRRFLDITSLRRIEAVVDSTFEPGHRWVKLLGFEVEAPRLRAYHPNGNDCVLYARIRHGA